jgi:hypothetical protein
MTLAPDGRIYIGIHVNAYYYHTIEYPNLKGDSCSIRPRNYRAVNSAYPFNIQLGQPPTPPNYNLGALPNKCVAINNSISNTKATKPIVQLWPSPSNGILKVSYTGTTLSTLAYTISNLLGHTLKQGTLQAGITNMLDVHSLPAGMYILATGGSSYKVVVE